MIVKVVLLPSLDVGRGCRIRISDRLRNGIERVVESERGIVTMEDLEFSGLLTKLCKYPTLLTSEIYTPWGQSYLPGLCLQMK